MKISNLFAFWAAQVYSHDANDRCLQPMAEVGMCRAHFRKYSFNVDEGKFQKIFDQQILKCPFFLTENIGQP